MKEIITGILLVYILCLSAVEADASWLLDVERFHVSAHGQNSCQDCHAEISDKSLHPDPAEVNKTLADFYRLEQCTACHEEVLENADEGSHGGEKIADEQAFNFCIGCHDPHYQLSYSEKTATLDLTQPVDKKCSLCHDLEKVLRSAIANAQQVALEEAKRIDEDDLVVVGAYANQGPTLKRIRPAPMGRAFRILHRTTHLTVKVAEKE